MSQIPKTSKPDTLSALKRKKTAHGLDVLATVYAFAMALGLTQVFLGSQSYLTRLLSGTAAVGDEKTILITLLFFNITLLGLRFFWVPRNLQGLVVEAARFDAIEPDIRKKGDLSNKSIAFHLVMIFLHGTLFYLICAEFEYVTFAVSSNLPLSSSVFSGYIMMHCALFLMNASWIAIIRRQEINFQNRSQNTEGPTTKSAGDIWLLNNLISGLLALTPFAIISTCQSASIECVKQSMQDPLNLLGLFPTSPQIFAKLYYDIVALLGLAGITSTHLPVYWVLVVLLFNSAFDLLNAGRFYIFFEDVEWDITPENTTHVCKKDPDK